MWAPTFRGNPGDPQKIDLDVKKLQDTLGDEWLVLIRVHPHMMKKYGEQNCPITTERLFPVVDILIADYSSLIYEYLLFEKPVVMYVPDLEKYQKTRGFYMQISEIPGPQVLEEEQLADVIAREYAAFKVECSEEKCPECASEKRRKFLKRYMENCDGHATKRIADWLMNE